MKYQIVVALIKSVNMIQAIVITITKSRIEKSKDQPTEF
jgi:hypothetical protein